MDKKLKAKWVRALNGGRYKKAVGHLKSRGNYCCLGVLANIQGARWHNEDGQLIPFVKGKRVSSPSDCGTSYLKIGFCNLHISTQRKLAELNDTGQSFKEIAAYIEKKL